MQSFRGAFELCQHVIKLGLSEKDCLYPPCMTGIIVSYMRPFKESHGIGSISNEFTKFPEPRFKAAHDELRRARDEFHAHNNAEKAHELEIREGAIGSPYETRLTFQIDADGKIRIYPAVLVPEITSDSLPGLVELFQFQMDRVHAATTAVLKSMASGKSYKLGTYTVGKDFP